MKVNESKLPIHYITVKYVLTCKAKLVGDFKTSFVKIDAVSAKI